MASSTRADFPWTNSRHIGRDLRTGVQALKDATPEGVLLGSSELAAELDRMDLIDEYQFLVHPRIAGRGPACRPIVAPPRGPAASLPNGLRGRRAAYQ